MTEIRIDPHTVQRAEERGVSVQEIEIVIREGEPVEAARGRAARFKVFDFYSIRNGRSYDQKKVLVVYQIHGSVIVTVTVYAFYGRWMAES